MNRTEFAIRALRGLWDFYDSEDPKRYLSLSDLECYLNESISGGELGIFSKHFSKDEQAQVLNALADYTPFVEKRRNKREYKYGKEFSETLGGSYPPVTDRKIYAVWANEVLKSEDGRFLRRKKIDEKIEKDVNINCSPDTRGRALKTMVKSNPYIQKKGKRKGTKYRWILNPWREQLSDFEKKKGDLHKKNELCEYCSEKKEVFIGERVVSQIPAFTGGEKIFFLYKAPPKSEGHFYDSLTLSRFREKTFELLRKVGFEIQNIEDFNNNGFYLSYVVKCPFKRDEVSYTGLPCYEKRLLKEISLVSPNVILPMGNTATRAIQDKLGLEKKDIKECHGESDYSSGLDLQISYNYSPTADVKEEVKQEDLKAGLKRGGFL